jgi:hypothetical protein
MLNFIVISVIKYGKGDHFTVSTVCMMYVRSAMKKKKKPGVPVD